MNRRNIFSVLLVITLVSVLTSCTYDPPEGYTEDHHTYEEMMDFAKSVDPDAMVSEEFIDIENDGHNRTLREWEAVINGIDCHVFSISRLVGNKGFAAGEFYKEFYVIDTDYDYLVLKYIVADKQPEWSLWDNRRSELIGVDTTYMEERELSREEFDAVYDEAYEIYLEYADRCISKEVFFNIKAPCVFVDFDTKYDDEGNIVGHKSKDVLKITGFTLSRYDWDRERAYSDYVEAWDLIDSGLPIVKEDYKSY